MKHERPEPLPGEHGLFKTELVLPAKTLTRHRRPRTGHLHLGGLVNHTGLHSALGYRTAEAETEH